MPLEVVFFLFSSFSLLFPSSGTPFLWCFLWLSLFSLSLSIHTFLHPIDLLHVFSVWITLRPHLRLIEQLPAVMNVSRTHFLPLLFLAFIFQIFPLFMIASIPNFSYLHSKVFYDTHYPLLMESSWSRMFRKLFFLSFSLFFFYDTFLFYDTDVHFT